MSPHSALHHTRATRSRNHETDFKGVVSRIQKAADRARTSEKKYTKASVLSLRWTNDDMNLEPIEAELLKTFRDLYNFHTDSFQIQHSQPARANQVLTRINRLIHTIQGTDSLLILACGGHSTWDAHHDDLELFGSTSPNAPRLNWDIIRSILTTFMGDVLVIMDCCEGTTAAIRHSEQEYLVASAIESSTAANATKCFTGRLIERLKESQGNEITVAQLHANLVADALSPDTGLDNTTVHVAAASKSSITLRPFQKASRDLRALKKGDTPGDGKVLVSVSLPGSYSKPNLEHWEKWLAQDIPEDVASVKIQAVFELAGSVLCLFTVPIEVWDMMEDHPAYCFIQFVFSDNKYLSETSPREDAEPQPLGMT